MLVPVLGLAALAWWTAGDDAVALTREAGAAIAEGRAATAQALASRAVTADASSLPAALALAEAAVLARDGAAAEAALARARGLGAPADRLAPLAAEAAILTGFTRRAETMLRGDDAATLRLRALVAERRRDPRAVALFARATAAAPRDARLWVELGRFRLGRGDVAGALEAAKRAITADPRHPAALLLAAELVRGQYGPVAARDLYARAVARDPSYPALIGRAATLGEAGEMRAMLAAARTALAARPNDPTALYLLAVLAARAGEVALASELLERAGPAMNALAGPSLLGATLQWTTGDAEQAVARLRSLVARQPRNLIAQTSLARALAATGAARGARDILEPLAARGDADGYVLTLAARCAERLGDRRAAAAWLDRAAAGTPRPAGPFATDDSVASADQRAMNAAPGNPSTTIPLIRALFQAGQGATALSRAQALARANAGVPGAWTLLGDALVMTGRAAPAAAAFARAANLRFDTPTMLKLAEARERAGDRAGAAQVAALFARQNPGSLPAARLMASAALARGDAAVAVRWIDTVRRRTGDGDALLLAMRVYAAPDDGRVADAARALAPMASPVQRLLAADARHR